MKILLIFIISVSAWAQTFVQATANDNSTAATSVSTPAATTTAGNMLYAFTAIDTNCSNAGSSGTYSCADTGNDAFNPVVPNGTGFILAFQMTATGTGYSATPSVTVSGCSSNGTYHAITSGTTPNISVIGVGQTTIASGCGPALPTVVFTGAHTGTTATAVISAVGVQASQCAASFYAANIAGTTNNVVTFTHPTYAFHGLSVQEWSGLTATPLDAEADGENTSSVTSVTTGTFTTAQAAEVAIIGSNEVNTALTWTAQSTWTVPTGASTSSAANHYPITTQYKVFNAIQTGVTATTATASKPGAMIGILGTFKAQAVTSTKIHHNVN